MRKISEENKSVIISCNDEVSSFLGLNRDKLDLLLILLGTKQQGKVTALMNKMSMGELAVNSGLNNTKDIVSSALQSL